jgi:hypothetical protein
VPLVGPANTEFCAALLKEKDNAGVVADVATDVVNKGLRLPALNDVTVPDPKPEIAEARTTAPVPVTPFDKSEADG